jgi:hypothetical protein
MQFQSLNIPLTLINIVPVINNVVCNYWCSLEATTTEWKHLEGRLVLLKAPSKVSVYLEGPPAGIDILVDSFYIQPALKPEPARPPVITVSIL